jgi:hypothetical protein
MGRDQPVWRQAGYLLRIQVDTPPLDELVALERQSEQSAARDRQNKSSAQKGEVKDSPYPGVEDSVVQEGQDKNFAILPGAGDLILSVKAQPGRMDITQRDFLQKVGLRLEVLIENGLEPFLGRCDGGGLSLGPILLPDLELLFLDFELFLEAGGGGCLPVEISDPDELTPGINPRPLEELLGLLAVEPGAEGVVQVVEDDQAFLVE